LGFGKKQYNQPSVEPFDNDDLQEVEKVRQMLNPNEEV
jgi:hypothetical protein